MKNILLVILDGLGDRPNKEFNNMTSLQASFRPNMNHLVSEGLGGILFPITPGIRAGSDTSHLSILGYNPVEVYTGRGPFEAMGLGMDVKPGDIAFRANFATIDENGIVTDRRAGRINSGTDKLASALRMNIDGVDFFVKEGVEHRAALVIRGDNLSDRVTDTDPHDLGRKPEIVKALDNEAAFSASVLNKFLAEAQTILGDHDVNLERIKNGLPPANVLLLRGPGKAPNLQPFHEKYNMKAAAISGIPMISGIAKLAGMDLLKVVGATGSLDSNFKNKFKAASKALKIYDFVLMNIKATDVAGHDGKPREKKKAIESIDAALSDLDFKPEEAVICITGDHSTPCSVKDHSGDPVPILFNTSGILGNHVRFFDEVSCLKTGFNLKGLDVMPYLLQLSDRAEKYGA